MTTPIDVGRQRPSWQEPNLDHYPPGVCVRDGCPRPATATSGAFCTPCLAALRG